MELYFSYPPLNLKGVEKFFYKTIVFSLRTLLIIIGLTFLLVGLPFLRVIGLWLVLIFMFYFGRSKYQAAADPRFPSSENLSDYCSNEALGCLFDTFKDAQAVAAEQAQVMLLFKLLQTNSIRFMLTSLNCNNQSLQQEILTYLSLVKNSPELDIRKSTDYTVKNNIVPVVQQAYALAQHLSLPLISPALLLVALRSTGGFYIKETLSKFRLTQEALIAALVLSRFRGKQPSALSDFNQAPLRSRWVNKGWRLILPPLLASVGTDATEAAAGGQTGFLIGHRQEVDSIIRLLDKRHTFHLLMTGDEGSGKGALVQHLAWRLAVDQVPKPFFDYRLIILDLNKLDSSEQQKQQLLLGCLRDAASAGGIVLYLPNLDQHFSFDRLNLPSRDLPLIITMTQASQISDFSQRHKYFSLIPMQKLSTPEFVALLACQAALLQTELQVRITPQAVATAASLAQFKLPLAVKILRRSCDLARQENLAYVTEEVVGDIACR